MIVRNEASVIARCLASVLPIVSHWVICDTGSSDGTQELVKENLRSIPGTLYEVPWVNFGHNRSIALQFAKGKADYHLLIDADMTLNVHGEFRDTLDGDCYLIRCEGSLDYWVERLMSDKHSWRYVGTTHECIFSETAEDVQKLQQISVTHHEDGSSRHEKYKRDIELLKLEIEQDPSNARALFYLAQSYRDYGNLLQAVECYERRSTMGGWKEEVWYSLYQAAHLQHLLGFAWPIVFDKYLVAYNYRPSRLEPILHLARCFREREQYHVGMLFSRLVLESVYPEDILFVERSVYDYELLAR